MRLAQIVMATVFSAAVALPVMAQTAATPAPAATAPASPKPAAAPAATPAPAAKTATSSSNGMKNGHYEKCTESSVVADADKMSINTASSADLDKLYGIGKARAKKIIDNRPFAAPEDVMSKAGIGKAEFADIKCHIKL